MDKKQPKHPPREEIPQSPFPALRPDLKKRDRTRLPVPPVPEGDKKPPERLRRQEDPWHEK